MQIRNGRIGFTLLELMVVVAIVGVLAAIAIPAFLKYVRRSRSTEALLNLRRLFDSSVSYFSTAHADQVGTIVPGQFPASVPPHPTLTSIGIDPIDSGDAVWQDETWAELNFALADPHYFAYQYDAQGTSIGATFTATAFGNLDGDAEFSTFLRVGTATNHYEVLGGAGIYKANDLE